MDDNPPSGVEITDLASSLDATNKQAQEASQKQSDKTRQILANARLRQTITDGLDQLAQVLTAHEPNVVVKNQPKPVTSVDVPKLSEVVARLQELIDLENQEDTYTPIVKALADLKTSVDGLPNKITIPEAEKVESVSVDNQIDYSGKFDALETSIKGLEVQPQVNLKPTIKVTNDFPELQKVTDAVTSVKKAVDSIKIPAAPKVDMKSVTDAVDKVYKAIANLSFPVPNYVLPFKDSTGKAVQVQLDAGGNIPTSGGASSGLTDAQLRATPVPENLTQVGGAALALGQTTRANSIPVTLPSDGAGVAYGTWGYNAGTAGTLTLTGGKRVLMISAIAEEAAATITINGGDVITLPYGATDKVSSAIEIKPSGNVTNPIIVFTGTKSYFVEYVS